MTLRAKLTLGFVILVVLIVGFISAVNLVVNMQQQFQATLQRADFLVPLATEYVTNALNSKLTVPVPVVLSEPELAGRLLQLLTQEHAILEIAVVDPKTNEILADSDPNRVRRASPTYPDFRALVARTGWTTQARVLMSRGAEANQYYQLEKPLQDQQTGEIVVVVRVIVSPALIRDDISPALERSAKLALFSVGGALTITILFSAVAFVPLGRLRRQLDLLVSGDYQAGQLVSADNAKDEVSIMASKVSLLGERLRGAEFEVSDLRGNIDRLLQDLEDAVFIFNRERRLVFASGAVRKFLGDSGAGLPGQTIAEIFPPSTALGLIVEQAVETGRSLRNRRVPLPPAGESGEEAGIVLLAIDIFETTPGDHRGAAFLVRLRDPEAQRKIGRELQTADRLAAISRVSGGVAHEVKNPLNAILLHVEVAKAKLAAGDTDIAQQMEIVGREILRLDRVVKTFLDFSRPVELHFETVPVHELLNEIVELARPQAEGAGIRIDVKEETDGVDVRVDRDLIKQAMLNVVVNAIEAMPGGGSLTFRAAIAEESVELRISDTGKGIQPEVRDKIFRLYFTTRKEGSGIGLAMTFRIVQLHDGTIDFTSEPGHGSTFFIRLPIAA
jgi:signal transduction histidine kinase